MSFMHFMVLFLFLTTIPLQPRLPFCRQPVFLQWALRFIQNIFPCPAILFSTMKNLKRMKVLNLQNSIFHFLFFMSFMLFMVIFIFSYHYPSPATPFLLPLVDISATGFEVSPGLYKQPFHL